MEKLKNYIAQREARFGTLKEDLLTMDERMEKQIEDIVRNLASLKDSNDSRTRVANMKEDVIKGLMRTVSSYKTKRVELFERMRKQSDVSPDELNKNMKAFDDRIAKRIDQVMEIAKSTPGHLDLKKYESYGDSSYNGYHNENSRVSED